MYGTAAEYVKFRDATSRNPFCINIKCQIDTRLSHWFYIMLMSIHLLDLLCCCVSNACKTWQGHLQMSLQKQTLLEIQHLSYRMSIIKDIQYSIAEAIVWAISNSMRWEYLFPSKTWEPAPWWRSNVKWTNIDIDFMQAKIKIRLKRTNPSLTKANPLKKSLSIA